MKKILIFTISIFLLYSCWSTDILSWDTNTTTGLVVEELENISLSIPENWKKIPESTLPIPKSGKVVFAVSSSEQREWYLNNIIILETDNTLWESSQSLMKNSANFLDMSLATFTLSKEENITFADKEEWILLTFEWKYNSETPQVTYLQTARSCGDKSYFLTLSLAEKLEDYSRYAYILKTFSCN